MTRTTGLEARIMARSGSTRVARIAMVLGILTVAVLFMTDSGVARGDQALISESLFESMEDFSGADGQEDGDSILLVSPQSGESMETAEGFALP